MHGLFKIRITAYLLLVLVTLLSVTSCSDKEVTETSAVTELITDAAEQTENAAVTCSSGSVDVPLEKVPVDWDGAQIVILCEDDSVRGDMYFAENDSDSVASLAKLRDERISENINVSIEYRNTLNLFDHVSQADGSGDVYHVVYASGGGGMSSLMLYGYLADLNSADGEIPSAGISVSALRQLSIKGALYMLTGAPVKTSVSNTVAVSYDKEALRSMGYDEDSLEELAFEGIWTHDMMHRLIKEAPSASFMCSEQDMYYLWQGMGAVAMTKAAGDIPRVSIYDPRNVFYFEHIHDSYSGFSAQSGTPLFSVESISSAEMRRGDGAAMLPLPSFHENEGYTCVLDFGSTFFTAIPACAGEAADLSVDYLGELYSVSIDTTYEAVIDKYSFGRERMLDLILKSRYFDFLDMYGIGHIMRSAFSVDSDTEDFDKLLRQRAVFAEQALDIALRQTVADQ